jgi:beta-lactamase class D
MERFVSPLLALFTTLSASAATDEKEVFLWDGKPKPIAAWERDHTLDSGMRESAIWMFQEIARRTGKERMREWVERLDYGNKDIGGGIDLFWLQGSLRVSATGTANPAKNAVSWWVGWVEKKGRPAAFFAMNFTPTKKTRYEDRFAIARAILDETGALPIGSPPS